MTQPSNIQKNEQQFDTRVFFSNKCVRIFYKIHANAYNLNFLEQTTDKLKIILLQ